MGNRKRFELSGVRVIEGSGYRDSTVKSKPIVNRKQTFSRASHRLHVFASSFDWFTELSVCFVIGQSNYFGFGFTITIHNKHNSFLDQLNWTLKAALMANKYQQVNGTVTENSQESPRKFSFQKKQIGLRTILFHKRYSVLFYYWKFYPMGAKSPILDGPAWTPGTRAKSFFLKVPKYCLVLRNVSAMSPSAVAKVSHRISLIYLVLIMNR